MASLVVFGPLYFVLCCRFLVVFHGFFADLTLFNVFYSFRRSGVCVFGFLSYLLVGFGFFFFDFVMLCSRSSLFGFDDWFGCVFDVCVNDWVFSFGFIYFLFDFSFVCLLLFVVF